MAGDKLNDSRQFHSEMSQPLDFHAACTMSPMNAEPRLAVVFHPDVVEPLIAFLLSSFSPPYNAGNFGVLQWSRRGPSRPYQVLDALD